MPTAVLVHGGFHGGWCWRRVADRLRTKGWDVHAPTLSGAADRAHLASPGIRLETHVRDIAGLIEFEELDDVVLCGHSAGGMVVTAVADRLPGRIKHVVHLDTMVPRDGESYFDAAGEESGMPEILRSQAVETDAGWLVSPEPFFTPEGLGVVDEADAAWLARRLTAHPLSALADKVVLSGAADRLPKTYVRCGRLPVPVLENLASSLANTPGWQVERWDCGHDVMITEPDRVTDLLCRIEDDRPAVAASQAAS